MDGVRCEVWGVIGEVWDARDGVMSDGWGVMGRGEVVWGIGSGWVKFVL